MRYRTSCDCSSENTDRYLILSDVLSLKMKCRFNASIFDAGSYIRIDTGERKKSENARNADASDEKLYIIAAIWPRRYYSM